MSRLRTRRPVFVTTVTLLAVTALAAAGAAGTSYRVKRGETLGQLARRFKVPVSALAEANGIKNVNLVRDGQVLDVPTSSPKRAPLASPVVVLGGTAGTHVVAWGESLAVIARRHKTTVAELVDLNQLANPDRILAGASLKVPGGTWLCPVNGHRSVVDNWGAPRPGRRRHVGNDIFAARGAPVVAPVGGVVKHTRGARSGVAFYLVGDDGVTYFGAHLDSYARRPGRVAAGEVIGAVGSTGNAAPLGPHLHFEIKPGGRAPVNPWYTLSKAC